MSPLRPATSTASTRVVTARRHDTTFVVYDPLTGQTYHADTELPCGRVRLADADIAGWPEIHPSAAQAEVPISVCWSPLVRCNLACPHCLDDKTVPALAGPDRQRIARLIAEAGVLGVDISGGEPLLLRELPYLIDSLTAGGCAVSVTTNGTHLARRAEALAAHVDAIRVSLDGPDAPRHDRWRGAGSFDLAVAGIRAAVAHGIPTQIQTVLLASTARTTAGPMIELAAALGIHGVTFLQMLPIGEGIALADSEQLTDDEASGLLATLTPAAGVTVRLRTREAAGGFTVIRADGQVWRNRPGAQVINTLRPLRAASDLALSERDGSA